MRRFDRMMVLLRPSTGRRRRRRALRRLTGTRKKMDQRWLFAAAGGGALLAFLLDPRQGRSRRTRIRQRAGGMIRKTTRRVGRARHGMAARAYGMAQRAAHRTEQPKELDDVALVERVRTEVLGAPGIPKGDIVVDAHDGIVVLRGRVEDVDLIRRIGRHTRETIGVMDVENLLHTGPDAPNKELARRASRAARER